MPKISVIVPVYKVEQYLDRCVESILAQTFTDFELILVDDGSPDNCPKMCDDWATKDARIKVIHKPNGGLSDARNAGIDWTFANSDSEWLTFIDSDDWINNIFLEKLYNDAINNMCSVSMGILYDICTEFKFSNDVHIGKTEDIYCKYYSHCISACCKLYKKNLFDNIRFPIGKLHEDAYITHLLLFQTENITINENAIYYVYQNNDSITRSKWSKKRLDEIDAYEKRLQYFSKKNYNAAYDRTIYAFVNVISNQLNQLNEHKVGNEKHITSLKKKLRKTMSNHKSLFSFQSKNYPLYEIVYPKRMYLYWTAKGLSNKIKGIFKK